MIDCYLTPSVMVSFNKFNQIVSDHTMVCCVYCSSTLPTYFVVWKLNFVTNVAF